MLNASPTFSSASRVVPQVTAGHRQPPFSLQHDSFENHNKVRLLEPTQPNALTQRSGGGQDEISHGWLSMFPDETTISLADLDLVTYVTTKTSWLEESLNELAACPTDALDEGLEEPSESGLKKAKHLLQDVSCYVTEQPDIYPMDEGAIAIDFRTPEADAGVLFLIEQNGSGALFHRTRNSKGRLRVEDAADLLREGGLRELERVGIR